MDNQTLDTMTPEGMGGTGAPDVLSMWTPLEVLELSKAIDIPTRTVDGEPAKFAGYVGGWMSIGTRDRQGETIDPTGLDVSMLMQDGWYNSDHSKDHLEKVGYPVITELRDHPELGKAWWTEGPILDTERGRKTMELTRALRGTDRQMGFSVQGPPPERDPLNKNRIIKARVFDVAITTRPVHNDARIELVKSLSASNGLGEALAAFAAVDPANARVLWDVLRRASLAKSIETAAPAVNVGDEAGAVIQRESIATPATKPRRKRKTFTYREAMTKLLDELGPLGFTPEMARQTLAIMPAQ